MSQLYEKTFIDSWYHKYLVGAYFTKKGKPFIHRNMPDDQESEKCEKYKNKFKEISGIYSELRKHENSTQDIQELINGTLLKWFQINDFYDAYWMGLVCDKYGVPLYMKTRQSFAFAKEYQDQMEKNNVSFEKFMKQQEDNKKNRAKKMKRERSEERKKKKRKEKKNPAVMDVIRRKAPQNRKKYQKLQPLPYGATKSDANYIGGLEPAKEIKERMRQVQPRQRDPSAKYIGGSPKRNAAERKKIQPIKKGKNKYAMTNPSRNVDKSMIKKRLNKRMMKSKKSELKKKMRLLKMQMSSLL